MEVVAIVLGIALAIGGARFVLRRRGPRAVSIDPFAVGEPWRRHVAASLSAQSRYTKIIDGTQPGPLRERLQTIGISVQAAVQECWQVAKRGDGLDDTLRTLNAASLRSQLDRAVDDAAKASLQSQLDSADRIRTTRDEADTQLRSLTARMGELVTQAAEVSLGVDATNDIGTAVDEVVTQLEAMRLAVDDVSGRGRQTPSP
jgi:uncharacterized phage infection (PIP) family protein YhgE